MERRDVLKLGLLGAVGAGVLATPLPETALSKSASRLSSRDFPAVFAAAFRRPQVLRPFSTGVDAEGPVARFSLTATAGTARILPRLTTPVLTYAGVSPAPTIVVDDGTRVELRVRNKMPLAHPQYGYPLSTVMHLHGSRSEPQYDGYADDAIPVQSSKQFHYPCDQGARSIWYHDHSAHRTATNVYSGLAGHFHVKDDYERGQLPQGEFDVPLTITDAMFASDGRLLFDDDGHKGLSGDVILVNHVPWPVLRVKRRVYRFRFLVAAISRSFRFRLSSGEPFVVVGNDGGLLPVPQEVAWFRQGTGERVEVLVDFSGYAPGTRVSLLNDSNENNVDYRHTDKVMQFLVVDDAFDGTNDGIPTALDVNPQVAEVLALTPEMATRRVEVPLKHDDVTNEFSIGGLTWARVKTSGYREVLTDAQIGEVQLWEIENKSGGWFHPMHLHLADFRVLWRRSTPGNLPHPWELGAKDTVYVGEDDIVNILVKFTVPKGSSGGRYMVHCHNLPHEDFDMMTQFRVGANEVGADPNDPILAAPAVRDYLRPDSPTWEPSFPAGT
nr:multicopper oxidase family protein [uncultured Actinotalea sp.]